MEFLILLLLFTGFVVIVVPSLVFMTHLLSGSSNPTCETGATFVETFKVFKPAWSFLRQGTQPVARRMKKKESFTDVQARIQKYDALQRLQALLDNGTISVEQFNSEKNAIFGERQR